MSAGDKVLKVSADLRVDRESIDYYYLLDLTRFFQKPEFRNSMYMYPWKAVVPGKDRGVFDISFEATDLGGLLPQIIYADGQIGETRIQRSVEGQFEVVIQKVELTKEQRDARKKFQGWLSRINVMGILPYTVSVAPSSTAWSVVSVRNIPLWDMISHTF